MTLLGARIGTTPFYMPLVWMFVIAVIFWFVLTRLRYGNWTFATGGKVGPAKAMGVPTARVKRINFVMSCVPRRARRLHAVRLSARRDPGAGAELRAARDHRRGARRHVAVRRHRHDLGQRSSARSCCQSIQIGLVLIGVPGSFYVTFIGVMLVVVVIANVRLGRFGSSQA